MKEKYEENMMKKIEEDMKLNKKFYITTEPIYGEKISIDTLEYFDEVIGIKIYAYNTEIASYDYKKKNISFRTTIHNIMVVKALVDLLNDFTGYEKYKIKDKFLIDFENYKEEVDSECNLSDYEIACMYELQ